MISIAKPLLGEEEKRAVMEVLNSGWLVQGPRVKAFEEAFADYVGTKYAAAVTNGTAALQTAFISMGLSQGDEVITTPFSFVASSNAIRFCGAVPVFADIDPVNFNLDPVKIEEKINDKTKAIMPVHLYGNPADMATINAIAKKHNLQVIEDSAQAHGAEINGKRCGSFGAMACFSFYPSKNMTTGEGGIVTTNDAMLDEKLRLFRNHGQTGPYIHSSIGYNFRMTEMCAAIGIEQLKKLEKFNSVRIENARFLTEQLYGLEHVSVPVVREGTKHVFHQYTIRILNDHRDDVQKFMKDKGIDTRVFYPVPIHRQEFYSAGETYPETEKAAAEVLSLPVHPALSQEDLVYIVKSLKESIKA